MGKGRRNSQRTIGDPAIAGRSVVRACARSVRRVARRLRKLDDETPTREQIHELRIATRRAGSTIAAFSDVIGRRKARRIRVLLREVRRAAGEARDADVLAILLRSLSDLEGFEHSRAVAYTLGALDHRSLRGRDEIRAIAAGRIAERLQRQGKRLGLGGRNRRVERCGIRTSAMERITGGVGRAMDALDDTPDRLHDLRIAIKRARYTAEVFGRLGEDQARSWAQRLKPLQDELGDLNDLAVLSGVVDDLAGNPAHADSHALSDEFLRLARAIDRRREEAERTFRARWPTMRLRAHLGLDADHTPGRAADARESHRPSQTVVRESRSNR